MLTEQEEGKVRNIIDAFDNGKSVTELNAATSLGNDDVMEVLQGGENKKVPVSVVKESVNSDVLTDLNKRGVFNVTVSVPLSAGTYYTLSTAIAAVPTASKTLGLDLKFSTAANTWVVYRYKGSDLTGWATTTNWEQVPDAAKLSSLETDLNIIKDKVNESVDTSVDLVQTTGSDAAKVMSQKVTTEELNRRAEKTALAALEADLGEINGKVNALVNSAYGTINATEEIGFFVTDSAGHIAMSYGENGLDAAKISDHFKSLLPEPAKVLLENPQTRLLEINHIVTYGQSLGDGDGAMPIITTEAKFENMIMFNQGVNSNQNTTTELEKYKTFVPHVEKQWGTKGESPSAGCAEQFSLCANLNQYKKVLSSNASMGAMTISQLSKGSAHYNRIITDATNAYRMSVALGKSYRMLAITWTQGEWDLSAGTTKENYKTLLRQLRSDLIADLNVITGQDYSRLPVIMYQMTSSGVTYDNRNIAHAMYELSIEECSYFYLATPIYILEFSDGTGGWHVNGKSSKRLGSYYGYVLSEVLFNDARKPIHPISHRVDGNDVYVRFHVPVGRLAFDTPPNVSSLGVIQNHGFSIIALNDTDVLSAVELIGSDEIKFTCRSNPSGFTLQYGQLLKNSIRGQFAGSLHDTNSVATIISNEEFKLWNWAPIFNYKF